MKKILFLLLLPIFAIAQTNSAKAEDATFLITGVVAGLPDSTFVFISHPSDASKMLATAYSKKGAFTLFGNIENPDLYRISFIGQTESADIFLSNTKQTVSGSVKELAKLKITGSPVHTDYEIYLSRFNPIKNKLDKLANYINSTGQGAPRDSAIRLFEAAKGQVLSLVGTFIKEKPASPVSSYVLYITSPVATSMEALEAQYNSLKPSALNTVYAGELQKIFFSNKIGAEGTMAVDFTQNDTANVPVSLSSYKGKYVLVDFWASWCRPCRIENPAVVAAFNEYKDKNFTVLGVSLDQSRENWINAIHVDNLTWSHVSDLKSWSNAVAQLYKIQGIPANMLINPEGKIIARNLRGEDLHRTLKQLLK